MSKEGEHRCVHGYTERELCPICDEKPETYDFTTDDCIDDVYRPHWEEEERVRHSAWVNRLIWVGIISGVAFFAFISLPPLVALFMLIVGLLIVAASRY